MVVISSKVNSLNTNQLPLWSVFDLYVSDGALCWLFFYNSMLPSVLWLSLPHQLTSLPHLMWNVWETREFCLSCFRFSQYSRCERLLRAYNSLYVGLWWCHGQSQLEWTAVAPPPRRSHCRLIQCVKDQPLCVSEERHLCWNTWLTV